jgi:hypothetical protein
MSGRFEQETLKASLERLAIDSESFFEKAELALKDVPREERWGQRLERDYFWEKLPSSLQE